MDVPSRGKCYGAVLKAGTIWAWNGEGFGREEGAHARTTFGCDEAERKRTR